jgi:TonB-linked SusC/RagA family outer membrane protein
MERFNLLRKFLAVIVLLMLSLFTVNAQNVTVTGTVTGSDDGLPLAGVTVMQKGTTNGTSTNTDGKYSISVPREATLVFSFIGMQPQEYKVIDQRSINVVMAPSAVMMEEVVVTALGLSREKKSLGYAVTEVAGADVARVRDLNVVNSLSGRVSGVVVTQGTFGPGSSSRVIIRGNNSLTGNNQPLYVVDGIPIDNTGYGSASSSDAGEYSKYDYGSGISDLNPDDIESMSVLKGPNAAALYGSRAANGVILITTKKGALNKGLGVTYTGNFTFESPLLIPKFQNEYGQGTGGNVPANIGDLRNTAGSWGAKLDGSNLIYGTGLNGETRPYVAVSDNVKSFFNTGSTLVNTIALDGGDARSTLRFSYTNTSANSMVPGSDLTRHNFNLRATTNLTDKFNVDAKVTYFLQSSHNRPVMGTEGVIAWLYRTARNISMNDLGPEQEKYQDPATYIYKTFTSGTFGNPYWYQLHDINDDNRSRIQGYVKANYDFTDWLSAFVRVGTDAVNEKVETVNQYGHWYYQTGRMNNSMAKTSETNIDGLIMFKKDLSDKINLSLNVGANHLYQTYEGMSVYAEKFKIPTKPNLESAATNLPSYTPLSEKIINSVYGSAVLSYANFLYLEGSARNDWSSTLPSDNWSYFYPSVGLSVLLNELLKIDAINLAKLRANWAKVGSDTDPYQLQNAFNLSSAGDSYLGLTILTRPSTRKNPNLKPEQTSSLEIGGEFRFFNNRLYTDLSFYSIVSKDLIMDVPIPASTGYSYERTNVGEMTNKGFEMLIGGIPVQTNKFSWDISLNMSTNKNKLVSLIEGVDNFVFTTTNNGVAEVWATVGGGYGDIYATTYQRNEAGKIVVTDAGLFQTASEKVLVGNYQPDWVGGLSNTLTYGNLSLRFLIDARIGGEVYSGTDAGLDAFGVSDASLKYREGGVVIDGVRADGTPNTVNITGQQYWSSYSGVGENYIFDQTNIRLREASLTYSLPGKYIENTFVKGLSVGVTGRNLFFLYRALENYDPEGSFSVSNFAQGVLYYTMPTARSVGFNVSIKF